MAPLTEMLFRFRSTCVDSVDFCVLLLREGHNMYIYVSREHLLQMYSLQLRVVYLIE